MFIFPILLLLLAVWFILFLFRGGSYVSNQAPSRHNDAPIQRESTPMEILNLRYVNGEIPEEEYQRIKKNLQS